MKLQRLELESFRGATHRSVIEFDPRRSVTIVFGENGTGKTTIVDAFDAIANGTSGSLQDKKGIGRTAKWISSVNSQPADLKATLVSSDGSWDATLSGSNILQNGDSPPIVKVLRRHTIQQLLEALPAERYKAIAPFVECGVIEKCETSLNDLLKEARSEGQQATDQLAQAERHLTAEWEESGSPGESAFTWANQEIDSDEEEIPDHSYLSDSKEALGAILRRLGDWESQRSDLADKETVVTEAQAALEEEKKRTVEGADLVMDVLQKAEDFLKAEPDAEQCPVCGQNIDASELSASISERLGAIEALQTATAAVKTAERARDQEAARYSRALESAATRIREFSTETADFEAGFRDSVQVLLGAPETIEAESDEELVRRLHESRETLQTFADGLDDQISAAHGLESKREGLKRHLEIYEKARDTAANRFALEKKAETALAVVRKKRQEYTDSILAEIQSEVDALYQQIHPGEPLGDLRLQLDPKRRASLDVQARFYDIEEVPPGAYFSESHLDTLGVCIFLALAKRGDAERTIIVFDDVVNSADEAHLDRLVTLLYDQSQHFAHIFITTHYRPWREKYRWGRLRSGDCCFLELRPWTVDVGLRIQSMVPPVVELRELVAAENPDPQKLASFAGIVLEQLLDFIVRTYRCRLPVTGLDAWTLGDLLGGLNSKLKKALVIEIIEDGEVATRIEMGPMIENLRQQTQLRNLHGCHYNPAGFDIPPSEAAAFAADVLTFAEVMCTEAGLLPLSNKSGSYWETRCKSKRMHPLAHPQ